jgi:benzoyl-CoA-dihydrodiol lyase
LADAFCTTEEGVKGKRAVQWRLVDAIASNSKFDAAVAGAAAKLAASVDKPAGVKGIALGPINRAISADGVVYSTVKVEIDRAARRASVIVHGPTEAPPVDVAAMQALGDAFWSLRAARELDDALLHLRLNALEIGTIVFKTEGDAGKVLAHDAFLDGARDHWLAREILNNWRRVLRRIDVTSRSLVAMVEHGSCFAGTLAEIAFASDRTFMFAGTRKGDNRPAPVLMVSDLNFGTFTMSNDLTRLATRFLGEPESVAAAREKIGKVIDASDAEDLGLVTASFDEVDWDDEVRIFLEERRGFSADGLTGMEANLRFAGPETMETKIFGRLTAWQNWIFQRPNAVGENGALKRYGSGVKGDFNPERV